VTDALLIDDFATADLVSRLRTRWTATSDRVMGGVSRCSLTVELDGSQRWLRLSGRVSLENNGGFIQMGLDLAPGGEPVDLSAFAGIRVLVRGNGERYGCHLRTTACHRPWQSYRSEFAAPATESAIELPFASFAPHRVESPFDPAALRRLGLVAIGRAFDADLAVAEVAFYR
jgi:Complex I intermediate-associated protein 30 (CIA30)